MMTIRWNEMEFYLTFLKLQRIHRNEKNELNFIKKQNHVQ